MINTKSPGLPSADEIDIAALRAKYRQERDRRMRRDGQEQYVKPVDDFADVYEADPYLPTQPRDPIAEQIDVAVLVVIPPHRRADGKKPRYLRISTN